jgi:hypothetical protein
LKELLGVIETSVEFVKTNKLPRYLKNHVHLKKGSSNKDNYLLLLKGEAVSFSQQSSLKKFRFIKNLNKLPI